MLDVIDGDTALFQETVLEPERPRLHRVSIVWDGPGTLVNGLLKVDDAYGEAISRFFQRSFDEACRHVRECHYTRVSHLMDTTEEVAVDKTRRAMNYVRDNMASPFLMAMHFSHEKI